MQNALRSSLIQLTAHKAQGLFSGFFVLCLNRFLNLAGCGLQLRLNGVITQASLLVGEDTLLLGLNISHG